MIFDIILLSHDYIKNNPENSSGFFIYKRPVFGSPILV